MAEEIYEAVYDKLVRHGYIYIEKEDYPKVLEMVTKEERFKDFVAVHGVTVISTNKHRNVEVVKFTINDWKPYSENRVENAVS